MQLNLLEKTELRIFGLELQQVNLSRLAAAVAGVLELPVAQVLVVDVREDHVCLDILAKDIEIRQVIGKEKAILAELRRIDGLTVKDDAYINSDGILGLIGCDDLDATQIVARTEAMTGEIECGVLRRAIVYATGFEVQKGMIEDTNSPFLAALLSQQGYQATFGGILEDDRSMIAHAMRDAAERGIGLVITTGGVGAEDKDFSVEALTTLDPEAATPWTVKFPAGTGRHVKEGVRIGVGRYGLTTLIALPGPHDEIEAAAAALRKHCTTGRIDTVTLANEIAEILREKFRRGPQHPHFSPERHRGTEEN